MDELESWMAMAAEGGEVGSEGIDALVARGAAVVVPAVVERLDRGRAIPRWTAVLVALEDAARVPAMASHLDHANRTVRSALIRALGRSGDPAALEPLLAELARGRHLLTTVDALGELGAAAAVAPLRARVATLLGEPFAPARLGALRVAAREHGDVSDLQVLAACAGSLARLGDMSLAPAMIALAAPAADDGDLGDPQVRLAAVLALDVHVAPRVAAALHAACADPDDEVAEAALDATARLAGPADAERWLAVAAAAPERTDGVLRALETMTGERPDDGDLAGWWAGVAARFEPGVSYLFGEPATPHALVPLLQGRDVGIARQDLRSRTGLRFILDPLGGDPVTPRELARVEAWLAEHAARFTPGRVHRWGRDVDPAALA